MSYEIARRIKLVVGRVTERVLRGSGGGFKGSRGVNVDQVGSV